MNSSVRTYAGIISAVALVVSMAGPVPARADKGAYVVRNLVSDVPGAAEHTDPNLVNGWGVAFNQFGFVWVAANGTGVATLYDGNGNPQTLVVSIAGGKPTGIVFNGSTRDFIVTRGSASGPAAFLFATENGTIAAWAPGVTGTQAVTVVDNSASGAIYKGLALAADGNRFLLYAADFHNRRIDVFDTTFNRVTLSAGFADSSVPQNFGPFNV
jgi:uncharacterized protein (TIGR03118 family)